MADLSYLAVGLSVWVGRRRDCSNKGIVPQRENERSIDLGLVITLTRVCRVASFRGMAKGAFT
jgi:hypothetical protein